MPMTNYLETKLLAHTFSGQPYTPPGQVYVGLFTDAPAADGTGGTEVSGGNYSRVVGDFTTGAGAPSQSSLTSTIEFPEATADWGTVTWAVIFDAQTGGNRLVTAELTRPGDPGSPLPKMISAGDVLRIAQDNLRVQLGALADFGG